MKILSALVTREAREQRNLVTIACLGLPVLIAGVRHFLVADSPYAHEAMALAVIPCLVLLVLWAQLLDSSTREAESAMGESLERLPLRKGTLLGAKLLWFVALGLCLLAWGYLSEAVMTFAAGGMPAAIDLDELGTLHLLGYGAGLAGTLVVVAMGAWLRRPFVAGAAALAVIAGSAWILRSQAKALAELPEVLPLWSILTLWALALIGASVWVYRPGFTLPLEPLRRSLRFAGVLAVAGGSVALAQWGGDRSLPSFGEPNVYVVRGGVSPDGSLLWARVGRGTPLLLGGGKTTHGLWTLDSTSGELVHDFGRDVMVLSTSATTDVWHADGRLQVGRVGISGIDLVDPRSGEVSGSEAHTRSVRRSEEDGGYWMPYGDAGETRLIRCDRRPVPSVVADRYYSVSPAGGVMRHELAEDRHVELLAPQPELGAPDWYLRESHDARHLCVTFAGWKAVWYIDAQTGERRAELPADWGHWEWTGGSDPMATAQRIKHRTGASPYERLFLGPDGLREVELPCWGELRANTQAELLLFDGQGIQVIDRDGRFLRDLYRPRSD